MDVQADDASRNQATAKREHGNGKSEKADGNRGGPIPKTGGMADQRPLGEEPAADHHVGSDGGVLGG